MRVHAVCRLALACFLISQSQAADSSSSASGAHATPISTCPSRTINFITETLPQQCLWTAWSSNATAGVGDNSTAVVPPAVAAGNTTSASGDATAAGSDSAESTASADGSQASAAEQSASADAGTSVESAGPAPDPELEIDPLSDAASFLSFEEWKAQMLKKAGQSPEDVGKNTNGDAGSDMRRQPTGINQALDSLGDDSEIELDFAGFVDPEAVSKALPSTKIQTPPEEVREPSEPETPPKRSKEAGTTSKERHNYATFDCATVLKTNAESKGSKSILIENKDSYMLNPCSASNKFITVELCGDILIDTIALANYEFFSSTFRTFRASISDHYPVKADKWRELGTFEAQNIRGVQAFLVPNGLIWGRFLKIEFLSHFGSEFYCPVSLLRVHGKTMMEDYRHDMKAARGEDDGEDEEEVESEAAAAQAPEAAVEEPKDDGDDATVKELCGEDYPQSFATTLEQQLDLLTSTCSAKCSSCKMKDVSRLRLQDRVEAPRELPEAEHVWANISQMLTPEAFVSALIPVPTEDPLVTPPSKSLFDVSQNGTTSSTQTLRPDGSTMVSTGATNSSSDDLTSSRPASCETESSASPPPSPSPSPPALTSSSSTQIKPKQSSQSSSGSSVPAKEIPPTESESTSISSKASAEPNSKRSDSSSSSKGTSSSSSSKSSGTSSSSKGTGSSSSSKSAGSSSSSKGAGSSSSSKSAGSSSSSKGTGSSSSSGAQSQSASSKSGSSSSQSQSSSSNSQSSNKPPSSGSQASSKSASQAPAAAPTTQESFYKSVHKRLQLLEANSTLSLQYIEEQSRILRDAFTKVEKRQLSKTTSFLETLNGTVLSELREFRLQYEQIWQSTILELSSQREQSQKEAIALGARLAILADDVLWQKRLVYLQFGLIVLCLAMLAFSRSPAGASPYLEVPLLNSMLSRSASSLSPHRRFLRREIAAAAAADTESPLSPSPHLSPDYSPIHPHRSFVHHHHQHDHLRNPSDDTVKPFSPVPQMGAYMSPSASEDEAWPIPVPEDEVDEDEEEEEYRQQEEYEEDQRGRLGSPEPEQIIRRVNSTPALIQESEAEHRAGETDTDGDADIDADPNDDDEADESDFQSAVTEPSEDGRVFDDDEEGGLEFKIEGLPEPPRLAVDSI